MSLEALCQSCGLCCDGSLFTRVPLGVSEKVPEEKLAVVTNDYGARHVPQRCAALSGSVCQVYAERPLACRRYECLLFGALREGEVSLPEALEVVRRAQALVASRARARGLPRLPLRASAVRVSSRLRTASQALSPTLSPAGERETGFWLVVSILFLLGCETEEVRAWNSRRTVLEQQQAELQEREGQGATLDDRKARVSRFRAVLDLPAFVRERKIAARVFAEPGRVRLTVSESVEQCHEAVQALAESRWLTPEWRLRLEAGRCEWEARTDSGFEQLEQALVAPVVPWTAPPRSVFSRDVDSVKKAVATLEADVRAREARLGELATLEQRLDVVQPAVDALQARPPPCDLAVLERELALDADQRGKLLEVERTRLVHPLEPRGDFRLRGLVEVVDGIPLWHCEAR